MNQACRTSSRVSGSLPPCVFEQFMPLEKNSMITVIPRKYCSDSVYSSWKKYGRAFQNFHDPHSDPNRVFSTVFNMQIYTFSYLTVSLSLSRFVNICKYDCD
jgi:hypothetical protein